ncbi:hypothetical protein J0910_30140 [Nocardiopsis sp. CNT-189]|uniref:Imm52 family immunity protein n=1 Tax=Nocardiopsis oceanisediminis TaxID=2816862 RepID=UPI003B2DA947
MRFTASAFWGPRRHPASEYADSLSSCLSALKEISSDLSGWRSLGPSEEEAQANRPINTDSASILSFMEQGKELDESALTGVRLEFWNGKESASSFSMNCGITGGESRLKNNFLLRLPDTEEIEGGLYSENRSTAISAAIIRQFSPDWFTFSTKEFRKMQDRKVSAPYVGWLTYFSHLPETKKPTAPEVDIIDFHEGVLMKAAPSPKDTTTEDVARACKAVGIPLKC